jgi:hypothetical protein
MTRTITITVEVDAECDGIPEYALSEFITQELAADMSNAIQRIYIPDALHNGFASDPYEEHKLNVSLRASVSIA